jgi:hypothetical protein
MYSLDVQFNVALFWYVKKVKFALDGPEGE